MLFDRTVRDIDGARKKLLGRTRAFKLLTVSSVQESLQTMPIVLPHRESEEKVPDFINFIYVNISVCTTGRFLLISCYIYIFFFHFNKISCFPKYFVPLLGGGVGFPHLSRAQ